MKKIVIAILFVTLSMLVMSGFSQAQAQQTTTTNPTTMSQCLASGLTQEQCTNILDSKTNGAGGITNPVIGTLGDKAALANPSGTFLTYFITLWRAVITVGAIIVLIFFIWGALEWILAGGDSGKVGKARDRITQSIIGLVVLVASFTIIGFISQLFFGPDFNLLNLTIPTAVTTTN